MFINKETLRLEYEVESTQEGRKVIDICVKHMQISSRLFRTCKNNKAIFLNGVWGSVNRLCKSGDVITVMLDHDENTFDPEPISIEVVYEDCDMLVVNKPPFLVVHPTKGHPFGTLANALSYRQYELKEDYKIRFINRLDRDTSGVLLVAKNGYAQQIISEQMKANEVDKIYYALVEGIVEKDFDTIDLPIDRAQEEDVKRIVMDEGMPSITHYEVVERYKAHTLVQIKLETGRTHQIRVHFSHIGHPVLGDALYGSPSEMIDRQALHCYKMVAKPPREEEKKVFVAELPEDFKKAQMMAASL